MKLPEIPTNNPNLEEMRQPLALDILKTTSAGKSYSIEISSTEMRDHSYVTEGQADPRNLAKTTCLELSRCSAVSNQFDNMRRSMTSFPRPIKGIVADMASLCRRSSELSDPDTDSASETETELVKTDSPAKICPIFPSDVAKTQLTSLDADFILTPPVTPRPKCLSSPERIASEMSLYEADATADDVAVETPTLSPRPASGPEPTSPDTSISAQIKCKPAPDGVDHFVVDDPFTGPLVSHPPKREPRPSSLSTICLTNVTSIGSYYQTNCLKTCIQRTVGSMRMSSKDNISVKIVNGRIVHTSNREMSRRAPNTYKALTNPSNAASSDEADSSSGNDTRPGCARTGNQFAVTAGCTPDPYPLCDHSYSNHAPRTIAKFSAPPSPALVDPRSSEILRAALLNHTVPPTSNSAPERPPPPPYRPAETHSRDFASESDRAEFDAKLRFSADERRSKKLLRNKQCELRKLRLTAECCPGAVATDSASAAVTSSGSTGSTTSWPQLTSRQKAIRERDGSYVKITGSYQDDYVYYATKRSRGRPRKPSNDETSGFVPKETYPVIAYSAARHVPALPQGANVKITSTQSNEFFDWYHDLSTTEDKDSHFSAAPSFTLASDSTQDFAENDKKSPTDEPANQPSSTLQREGDMTPEAFLSLLNDMDPTGLQELERTLSLDVTPDESLKQAASADPELRRTSVRTPSSSPPQLTTVSMYWNDLPGLIIDCVQFIRLVDIHKQILPAKDTGILKKRCMMLEMCVSHCTELERDFLIRYANAAKSKSLLVIDKSQAQQLIAFYVNPRARTTQRSTSEDEHLLESQSLLHLKENKQNIGMSRKSVGIIHFRNRRKHQCPSLPSGEHQALKRCRKMSSMPPSKKHKKKNPTIGHRDLAMPRRSLYKKGRYAAMIKDKPYTAVEALTPSSQSTPGDDEEINVVDTDNSITDADKLRDCTRPICVRHCECSPNTCSHHAHLHVDKYMDNETPCIQCPACGNGASLLSVSDFMKHFHGEIYIPRSLRHVILDKLDANYCINSWVQFKHKSIPASFRNGKLHPPSQNPRPLNSRYEASPLAIAKSAIIEPVVTSPATEIGSEYVKNEVDRSTTSIKIEATPPSPTVGGAPITSLATEIKREALSPMKTYPETFDPTTATSPPHVVYTTPSVRKLCLKRNATSDSLRSSKRLRKRKQFHPIEL